MTDLPYLRQLERRYSAYLKDIVTERPFQPIALRGGKDYPDTTVELHRMIELFRKHQKQDGKMGWEIEWDDWKSKRFGNQRWPKNVTVAAEDDFLHLIGKAQEAARFKSILSTLIGWRTGMRGWLQLHTGDILRFQSDWEQLMKVVDHLLQHDVTGHYIRSIPLPVHTKFLEKYDRVILSIIRHLSPERLFSESDYTDTLESALGMKTKPELFTIRWLDPALAERYTQGLPVLGLPVDTLRAVEWDCSECWIVENETNLYLLPERKQACAVFGRGMAVELLRDLSIFRNIRLSYWGDLDEKGFFMLARMRSHYPHLRSFCMDEDTLRLHQNEIQELSDPYKLKQVQGLTDDEATAFELLRQRKGRLEQERIRMDYVHDQLNKM